MLYCQTGDEFAVRTELPSEFTHNFHTRREALEISEQTWLGIRGAC